MARDETNHGGNLCQIRAAYERGRLRNALFALAPCLVATAVAYKYGLAGTLGRASLFGVLMVGVTSLWFGRDLARAVVPGIASGVVALVAMIVTLSALGSVRGHAVWGYLSALGAGTAAVVASCFGSRHRTGARYLVMVVVLAALVVVAGVGCGPDGPGHAGSVWRGA